MKGEKRGAIRLALCCLFVDQPIKYRAATAARLLKHSRREQLQILSEICLHNVQAIIDALRWLGERGIKGYRIPSPIFPRYTHPDVGYNLEMLPNAEEISNRLEHIRQLQSEQGFRLSLHPDQFNVLSSHREEVVENTIRELEYQGLLAELIGADVINIHGGGGYGNKPEALERFRHNFERLSDRVRSRLTIENDDRTYSVEDLLPLCHAIDRPLVYDIHHHRCLVDSLSEAEATAECVRLWKKVGEEPYFHISSPAQGWQGGDPRPHADYIDPQDFPEEWQTLKATIDIEAKAKELAVLNLREFLEKSEP